MADAIPGEGQPPAYRIETPRLVLRPWDPADAAVLARLVTENLDHLRPWMPWAARPPTVDEQLAVIRSFRAAFDTSRDFVYGAFLPDGRAIGGTGLHPRVGPGAVEIGYWLSAEHEGEGYVTEWCAALVQVAFAAHRVDRVEIHCDPGNERSAAVARRLGFRHEVTLRRRTIGVDGEPRDAMVWTLFADELARSPCAPIPVRAFDGAGRRLH